MPTFRNGSLISFGEVAITPASINLDALTAAPNISDSESESETQIPIAQINPNIAVGPTTATNFNALSSTESIATSTTSFMNPIVALRGTDSSSQPDPISIPSNEIPTSSSPEEVAQPSLPLQLFTRSNGITIRTISNIRPDLLATTDFKSIYQTQNLNLTNFGTYLDDLYKASVLQDGVRRYIIVNNLLTRREEMRDLTLAINNNIVSSLWRTQSTISNLDVLINLLNKVKKVLDIKKLLGGTNQTQPISPLLKLPDFFTGRMLFSAEAYNSFSDTKIAYQLISDLTNIMSLCSFNLLDNFRDLDRLQSPRTARLGTVVDPITIDTVYGTGLRYTPSAISNIYITNYATYNSVINVLPPETDNRIKFLINLLSKEFRVSYGLGNSTQTSQLATEKAFFGFGSSGNPFQTINGTVPPDIFVAPNGGLASLFYQQIENNAVVLPFESRQVAGDGETIFVPGPVFFGDGILNNNLTNYQTYRDSFSNFYTLARNSYNGLLLQDTPIFQTLKQTSLLQSAVRLFQNVQNQFKNSIQGFEVFSGNITDTALTGRKETTTVRRGGQGATVLPRVQNIDSTNLLIYAIFLLCQGNTRLKFEFYNLFLLLILYTTRQENDGTGSSTNNFRQNLFNELSTRSPNGRTISERNLESATLAQINVVRSLFETTVLRNPSNSSTQIGNLLNLDEFVTSLTISLAQFSQLTNCLKPTSSGQNLLQAAFAFAENLFNTCSVNNNPIHLAQGSTVTRYNGLTMSGMLLLSFELFYSFAQKFSTDVRVNIQANKEEEGSDLLKIDMTLDTETVTSFFNFIRSSTGLVEVDEAARASNILVSYNDKLREEDEIVTNILEFFGLLNSSFSEISTDSVNSLDLSQLREFGVNKVNLGSVRTAKSILKNFADKGRAVNWTSTVGFEFYNPSGKYVSNSNWYATKIALQDPKFATLNKQKIITIGIPNGFLDAALSAKLSKNNVAGDSLNLEESDLINVKIYRLGKNDGLIYNPISFKFDMSLFPYGFDGAFRMTNGTAIVPQPTDTYLNLLSRFKFYDFDETTEYRLVVPKTISDLERSDLFYATRRDYAVEVVNNLYTSFILDNYLNILTGLNFNEETFFDYQNDEINGLVNSINSYVQNGTSLVNVKEMSSAHQDFLNFFTNRTEQKLMLTLCNDVGRNVLKPKVYDRTFHVVFDPNKFSINVNATKQKPGGEELLTNLGTTDQTEEINGLLYRRSENFDISQYFINVEIIN